MTRCVLARAVLVSLALFLPHPGAVAAAAPEAGPVGPAPRQEAGQDTAAEEEEDGDGLPLEPARTLSFTTSEGSWLSLDVSPDGETLVFELLGDLYLLPVEGGEARPLTSGMAFDSQPRFGPDGERVLFVSDRSGGENLWIVSRDGSETRQVTKGKQNRYHSPEWTPDGEYVVASRKEGFLGDPAKLWLFHVEGGSGTPLIDEPEGLRTSGAAFGADGRWVWHAERRGSWEYNAELPQYQLAVYDRETGRRYTRSYRYGSAFRPTLSPDGEWLVYGTRHDEETGLRIRDLETGDERWLAYPVQHDDQESIATRDVYPGMSFTPDSRHLVASYGGKIWKIPVEEGGEPEEIPFTAEVELALGPELDFEYPIPDSTHFTARQIRDAVPSPDGERLAFTALDRVYVMDYPDGTPRRLTDSEGVTEAEPTWSPDGRWIAYVTWSTEQGEGGHLYRVRSDGGSGPERLTERPGLYQEPAWSLRGDRIVAVRGPARAYTERQGPFAPGAADDLIWVPADGGEARTIAPVQGRRSPHFVEGEPGRIYLYHGEKGLVSIRYDGTDEKQHLKVKGERVPGGDEPQTASLVKMAPEGDRALAEVGWHLYAVTVPYVGGEPPTISVARPDRAAFPARKLTRIAGEFPAWGRDGRRIHWSLGKSHFVYDLAAAKAAEDSARAAEEVEAEEEDGKEAGGEGAEPDGGEAEADEAGPVYEPAETEVVVRARRDVPRGVLALEGARVVTMDGDEVIEDGVILIRDNRIAAVGPRGSVEVPGEAEVRDVSGKTIVPGFVDTHAHIWPAWGIHKTEVAGYLANLAYGVTTTRDPQTSTTDVLTYSDQVEAGQMLGPRIYSTGPGIFWSTTIGDLEEARDVVGKYSRYFDTKTIKQYLAGNRQQRQWVIMAAREQELMPTTEGALDLKLDLTQIIDGYPGHEHSFPVFPLYRDMDELMAFTDVTYTPTLLVAYGGPWAENYFYSRHNPHDSEKLRRFTPHQELDQKTRRRGAGWFMEEEHVFQEQSRELAEMVAAGGEAGVGSHGQLQGLGYHWELWAVAAGGLSNHEALRAATLHGARGIGLEGDVGSLEPGKLADLVVLEENPLEDLRATNTVTHVMKNGRLYAADTLAEVWPRQRELGELYWRGRDPRPSRLPGETGR